MERPIIFNTQMVQAIINGNKKITRRVIKVRGFEWIHEDKFVHVEHPKEGVSEIWWDVIRGGPTCVDQDYDYMKCPYGKPGDLLYVRETWIDNVEKCMDDFGVVDTHEPSIRFRANSMDEQIINEREWNWKPSIYMPKQIARIWLKVKDVRVERAQDITVEDMIAEGLSTKYREFDAECDLRNKWWQLWDFINGKRDGGIYSWDSNPWVWVVEFEVVSTTGRPA